MFEKLINLIENSYAPHSNFKVASIVVYEDGSEFPGVNVENYSFGATNCAERTAIFTAITNGKKDIPIKEVHILSKDESYKNPEKYIEPCGICRQVISEFSSDKTLIVKWNLKGEKQIDKFIDLFPKKFERGTN